MHITVPDAIRVETSTLCQLRCPSCPTSTTAFKAAVGRGLLSFRNFSALVEANPGIRSIELSNYGEIFLNKELLDMLKYAYRRGVSLHAGNGVNLNNVDNELLEGVVRFSLRTMTCSIDGASHGTYRRYRVGGDFGRVISNVRRINMYKKIYKSPYPALTWQFVIFGHNQHEIAAARALANELGMEFHVKLSWDREFSPVTDADSVRREAGAANREEYRKSYGRRYAASCCELLWDEPQINWDGRMLGCNRNFWGEFGGNVFTEGLGAVINSSRMCYARDMLQGRRPPRRDIPCTTCDLYMDMQATGQWLQRQQGSRERRAMQQVCRALGLHHLRRWLNSNR